MSAGCCDHAPNEEESVGPFRKVLWIVFALNASMFVIEMAAGALARSVSLQADALDFLGDSATYLISLFVLAKSLRWRAGAAFVKGGTMGLFGLWVLGYSVMEAISGNVPVAPVMGVIGFMAMAVNVFCAVLLFRHRGGDSNRQSVWLCSRNDAIANVAVIIAAGFVFWLQSGWP
ncbi:MAG: cation transporter, partial [Alphaproteobacteria bacterium]|nr:cation transporter [Alphaproteobacteria bacterium]